MGKDKRTYQDRREYKLAWEAAHRETRRAQKRLCERRRKARIRHGGATREFWGSKCQSCGKETEKGVIHHLTYRNGRAYNVQTYLCSRCHRLIHQVSLEKMEREMAKRLDPLTQKLLKQVETKFEITWFQQLMKVMGGKVATGG